MVSVALMELADMMMDQYERVTGCYDKYELQNLRDAAKAGLQEFDSVCTQIFGANFERALFGSVKAAYDELSWNYENSSDPTAKTENDSLHAIQVIDLAIFREQYAGKLLLNINRTPFLRDVAAGYASLPDFCRSQSRKPSVGIRMRVPMRIVGNLDSFTNSYAFGRLMPICRASSWTLSTDFSVIVFPPCLIAAAFLESNDVCCINKLYPFKNTTCIVTL